MYDARDIAAWFVDRANKDGRQLSIMSLLKLTYIAHGWHLELRNKPLFHNLIQAWKYGPVIPDVYNDLRHQGINISKPSQNYRAQISQEDDRFLDQIWRIYGKLEPFQLSDITHVESGPWDIATKSGGPYATIPDELIRQHYVAKRHKANELAANG